MFLIVQESHEKQSIFGSYSNIQRIYLLQCNLIDNIACLHDIDSKEI